MKRLYILLTVGIAFISHQKLHSQTIWTGTTMTFTKAASTDWTLAVNQDRITANVWITRSYPGGGVFNIVSEGGYTPSLSPSGTEWAFGTTANIGSLTFDSWEETHSSNVSTILNQDMVLHLITDDIYIDIKFISWAKGNGQGNGGTGAFSYERSTDQGLEINEFEENKGTSIFPNPSSNFIQILDVSETVNYTIFDIIGSEINRGMTTDNGKIEIQHLTNGVYFLKLEDGNTLKFVKK